MQPQQQSLRVHTDQILSIVAYYCLAIRFPLLHNLFQFITDENYAIICFQSNFKWDLMFLSQFLQNLTSPLRLVLVCRRGLR